MDWSLSSAYIHPSDTLGRHGWDTAQPNNSQDARPPTEALPLSLSTGLHAGHMDEIETSWSKLAATLGEFDNTEYLTVGGTAHASLSLIGPQLEYFRPFDAECGLALTDSSKPAAEPVETKPKARYMGESLEVASCKREEIAKNALLCTWEGCRNPGPFSRKSALVRHSRAHTDPTWFKCGRCFKRFNRKDNLSQHVQRMHANQV